MLVGTVLVIVAEPVEPGATDKEPAEKTVGQDVGLTDESVNVLALHIAVSLFVTVTV